MLYRGLRQAEAGMRGVFIRGVFKAHRLVYHSTVGWRVIKKKKKVYESHEAIASQYLLVQGYLAHEKQPPPPS